MKRGAERQLTKDGPDDDDEIEIQDPQGFHKADDSALAKRQIRALPKRALAASKPLALNGLPPAPVSDVNAMDAVPPPKFGGFTGFGAGAAVSNSFTFMAQPPAASQPTPAPNPILAAPIFRAPRQPPLAPDASAPKPAASSSAEDTEAIALKYFKSLRGLNVSFLSAISSAVEKDPFFDVASLVDSYKNLRTTIQSEFDDPPKQSTTRAPSTTNSASLFGAKVSPEKTTPPFSVPKPPAGQTEASPIPPSTDESGAKNGGFIFPPFVPPSTSAPMQLPFSLTSKPSESPAPSSTTPEPANSAFKFPASSTPTSTSSLSPAPDFAVSALSNTENPTFNLTSASPSQETEESASSLSQPGLTAPTFASSSAPNFFAAPKATGTLATSDAAPKHMSVFGGSIFGNSNSTEANKLPPFNPPPSDNRENSKFTPTLFGGATTSSATPTNIFGSSSDQPTSVFGSASPPKTNAFTFGKPGGSIGNPVGFGFGNPSPSTGDGSSPSGFIFGAPLTKPSESLFSPPMTDRSSESTPQPEAEGNEEGGEEDTAKLLPSQAHDGEGEGEEDEETTYTLRCKVYRLATSDDKREWKDLGIGMFRLKKHKDTEVRRVLMRNSSTGRILINFRIYESLKPSASKNSVTFVGYENSAPTYFSIRAKTEGQATELKQALEREIAVVQAAK